MEWIRRNPKRVAALTAVPVLVAIAITWSVFGHAGPPSAGRSLGAAPLAWPTTTPSSGLRAFPTSSSSATAEPTAIPDAALAPTDFGSSGLSGTGFASSLAKHRVVLTAGADVPLQGVGWRIPLADGARSGTVKGGAPSFRRAATTYGSPDYAQLYTYVGPDGSSVWCTITVDGKVTDHRVAKGPWGQVFCRG